MSSFDIKKLAVPSVCILIVFLAYSSQFLFLYIEPGPLDRNELIKFNLLIICTWICYIRSWLTDPGRIPREWKPAGYKERSKGEPREDELFDTIYNRQRWCRRCEVFKPPRAHHCKTCQRCVPKMDHHCPWTANCVSHLTFPHFIRFLFYAVAAMSYLEYFLCTRASIVWQNRNMPSYYGPSVGQLIHLFLLLVTNSMVLFMLVILFLRTAWMLAVNQTTIEGWEIERHKTLVRRAKVFGGFLDGPDGMRIRIRKQEFPYDIGIWANIRDGMGGSNVLAWLFPFSATPSLESGLEFEVNGFEDPSTPWPPPDPDRLPRRPPSINPNSNPLLFPTPTAASMSTGFTPDSIAAFRQRQQADLLHQRTRHGITRQRPFHERYAPESKSVSDESEPSEDENSASGEEGWRTAEGERLADFGVDEDVEFYDYEGDYQAEDADEDDIPLALLKTSLVARRSRSSNDSASVSARDSHR